jgi:CheY-like chemotaxis protein
MDVQMPVIDGYRATHLIRHHAPYRVASGRIPIIAMTASAIQGDREKCMRAGMDDYVAKPVRGRTLERTLDRWALEGRGRRLGGGMGVLMVDRKGEGDEDEEGHEHKGSECPDTSEHLSSPYTKSPSKPPSIPAAPSPARTPSPHLEGTASPFPSPPSSTQRKRSSALTIPDPDLEGTAEEKALALRVEQLAEAAGQESGEGLGPCAEVLTQGHELTTENVGRLERGGDWGDRDEEGGSSKSEVGSEGGDDEREEGRTTTRTRPRVQRWPDSQRTITGL